MGAQSDASLGAQSERPKCEECAISGGAMRLCAPYVMWVPRELQISVGTAGPPLD